MLGTKLYSRHLIKGINSWAGSSHKIFGTILEVDQRRPQRNELENKKTNEPAKGLHPRKDVDSLKKRGRKGLASIEVCVDAQIQRLEDHIENAEED